jgi:hypothetical protein
MNTINGQKQTSEFPYYKQNEVISIKLLIKWKTILKK